MGNYHEAIRAYGDAIAASDRYTPAYVNRGLAYMMLGDFEKAIADFNDALRIEPTKGDYYFKRGVAYVQAGDLEKGTDSLASAIRFDPNHRDAYRHMADVLERLGRGELAEQYRQKASELESQRSAS
jgi:tetratricopeptide (TPR) repeat protein